MAFWKKKSEDPWDMDPNQKRKSVLYDERETGLQSELPPRFGSRPRKQEAEGLAMPESAAEAEVREAPEDAPACPWCGEKLVRAYLLGGRDLLRVSDQRPHRFWGSRGHEKTYLGDNTDFLGGNYRSCWQCKPCYKLVIDIPRPDVPVDEDCVPEGETFRGGNPAVPDPQKNE